MFARLEIITGSVALATLAVLGLWVSHQRPAPEFYLPVFAAVALLAYAGVSRQLARWDESYQRRKAKPQWRRVLETVATVVVFTLAGLALLITCLPRGF